MIELFSGTNAEEATSASYAFLKYLQKKLNVDKIVSFISKEFPEISSKETEVIEYIMLHFTTKEIAVLMDKSEKSIEYYRSQIRKKLQLQSNNTLEQYLNSRVKDSDS